MPASAVVPDDTLRIGIVPQATKSNDEPSQDVPSDPESDDDVPVEAEELQDALSRPPPVNSSYLPLPWRGRLGYACLNTYLRNATPPVFCSRTCRIASILENRHPLADPSQPPHPTKNRPDRDRTPDVARGQAYVESLGLANARDLIKLLRWNDKYGIKFMRLSSEMFPFASHKEYGYKLASFASEVLAEVGRVVAELGHRVSVHPGQFTQLGSPRLEVIESSIRDLEYHSEMLQLLQLPPQQDRDAVMILHMGGVFGDKEATLDRFRENYKGLSQDIKNRLVLENDDVSWSVHDLLPICDELNIPLVLDFHHHNIVFDSSQVREGTLDIMDLFHRIKATWTRKNITQKMHYSEPVPSAITNRQRRKHSDRVSTLPPCDPTMDLMIEAKDKEQAVFELMRRFKLPGHHLFNDVLPYTRTDENRPFKPPRKTKKNGGFVDLEAQVPPAPTVPEEEVGMGGPERRVYWPPGMEEWLRPKKIIRVKARQSPAKSNASKKKAKANEDSSQIKDEDADEEDEGPATPKPKTSRPPKRTASIPSISTLAPKIYPRSRWLAPPPTSQFRRQPLFRFLPSLLRPSNRDRQTRPGRLLRFFRLLIGPHATRRAQLRLWGLRHETIPAFRHRAQARVYRAIVQQQARRARRRISGKKGILELLLLGRRGPARRLGAGFAGGSQLVPRVKGLRAAGQAPDAAARSSMSQYESSASTSWGAGGGGRRKKVYEYLKAANELRQTYTAQWAAQRNNQRDYNEDYYNTPGAFSDVEITRSGNEEMVLFPSYARRLVKGKRPEVQARQRRDSTSTIDEYRGVSDDPEPASEWTRYEDEHAVVAVDVRGWVYAPHRGPMTRKHRLLIALARKLSGIPAPNTTLADDGNATVAVGTSTKTNGASEEEMVDQEMQSIINNAEKSADPVWKGSASDDRSSSASSEKTTQPSPLSKDELTVANAHLMERLRPFLTNPRAAMPVTVFFYNDEQSQSRNIMTDESGHFNLRATLPFVPTHIRVLASEELSATKEIQIIEPTGVSLISDIDDTVKHSAITNGAKEIFRNTFVRELADLTVDGVTDWYNELAKMGVEIHYVSNAPWQLYPLLERYFKLVGLPPGSFHLKQYSGMLQGIFEPTAERKRGSLEQILRDFPERKFILVGDSGEADLEVYTDIVLANPGRILGIFIRDVTTSDRKDFFDKSVDHLEGVTARSHSTPQLVDDSDAIAKRPALPPRRPRESPGPSTDAVSIDNGDLIDLLDEQEEKSVSADTPKPANFRTPPLKPSKPSSLRAVTTNSESTENGVSSQIQDLIRRKPVPPVPPRRQIATDQEESSSSPKASTQSTSYAGGALNAVQSVTNSLPAATKQLPFRPKSSDGNGAVDQPSDATKSARPKQAPPPPPPRRTNTGASTATSDSSVNRPTSQKIQSYPASAAAAAYQFASERLNWSASPAASLRSRASIPSLSRSSTNPVNNQSDSSSVPPPPLPNKREELWRRRWERANELLAEQGVVLGSWRVGKDMKDVSVWLVQQAVKDMQNDSKTHSDRKT
ncbi:hypothetical protein CNMCM8980_002568 [Aspergillus fumigatiaffinis]|uniref:Phosphatidate phosphatase APP1 catalytic domain-containing protein n=1 Tax=Aspergillus fumigatiaffinis TaxID=340414 RepID=A0A8H4M3W8_9EURO|nr:hypothetical protein CNMCM5878_004913 [Aspergillus fumigatiaffinis]KAF4226718.1 hypothetical protein CNMCM6457_007551 [Aspergillus fumigatiaffinis]KAF4227361.1 hypothetical protein CNMCM6805_003070 [Aspergillus fumigatiaffinis]KAF4249862.1 hypothetical protein CNMCM8980_002568 [Aspergillus fumigatiaffinis]